MKILRKLTPSKSQRPAPLSSEPDSLALALEEPSSASPEPSASPRCSSISVSPSRSMATGSFSSVGKVDHFVPSPTKPQQSPPSPRSPLRSSAPSPQVSKPQPPHHPTKQRSNSSLVARCLDEAKKNPVLNFKRTLSSFLRVADLNMDENLSLHTCSDSQSEQEEPHFHCSSVDPPPGMDTDPKERWVALDNGQGDHAPIAPFAVRALTRSALVSTFDSTIWTPGDAKTTKILKQHPATSKNKHWHTQTWQEHGNVELPARLTEERDVLLWAGSFQHGLYGSELPVVRSAGLMPCSPQTLMELLVDSDRVKEYNKLSLGRTDLLVLQKDINEGPFGGITKVMQSESKPPLVRKTLQFTSILHARQLEDGSGYILVTRAVTSPSQHVASAAGLLRSEILMGVNVIKRIQGSPEQCLMICINHIRSPGVPLMIAKRIGLSAAVNFIQDLRACTSSSS